MVSTTRPISCRTEVSRSGVSSLPWKYFEATMLVAVCDQDLGTSTFSWRKITWPFSLPICAVRRSHSTASKGARRAVGEVAAELETRLRARLGGSRCGRECFFVQGHLGF